MVNPKWKGYVEVKIMAPLEVVWKIASNFYEIHKWFLGMKLSERVEGLPKKGMGFVRRCITFDQGSNDVFFVEELIAQDNTKHSYVVCMTDTDMLGFVGYEASFELCETGEDDNYLFKWSFEMKPIEGRLKEEIEDLRRSILIDMVNNLQHLASSP